MTCNRRNLLALTRETLGKNASPENPMPAALPTALAAHEAEKPLWHVMTVDPTLAAIAGRSISYPVPGSPGLGDVRFAAKQTVRQRRAHVHGLRRFSRAPSDLR
jgi:hypothetical protein